MKRKIKNHKYHWINEHESFLKELVQKLLDNKIITPQKLKALWNIILVEDEEDRYSLVSDYDYYFKERRTNANS